MNFDEFKKRYIEKMVATGVYTTKELENDEKLTEQIMAVYVGMVVFSEWQNDELEKVMKKAERDAKKARKVITKEKEGEQ